ncbi:RDD family protein [Kitasatospora sp. NPDC052896]|uniref:RDD family protein n=1 Tax=Kitasatospora sp. NPDC052896 TaxID=3364061 RepID=UPI0037C745C6
MSTPYDPTTAYPNPPVLAHWGLRVAAFAIDWLIMAAVGVVVVLATGSSGLAEIVNFAALAIIANLEGSTGQSPGKRIVGTRVLREADGGLLGFGPALGRRLLHTLDALCCFLGFLWPLWDQRRQTFADKMIRSVVIRAR